MVCCLEQMLRSAAVAEFKEYLNSHIPSVIKKYRKDLVRLADKVTIDSSLSKSEYRNILDQTYTKIETKFVDEIRQLGLSEDTGSSSVQHYRNQLLDQIVTEKATRLASLEMKIDKYNRTLLNEITKSILIGVADYDITTVNQLQTAIDEAKREFYSRARGEAVDKDSVGNTNFMYQTGN